MIHCRYMCRVCALGVPVMVYVHVRMWGRYVPPTCMYLCGGEDMLRCRNMCDHVWVYWGYVPLGCICKCTCYGVRTYEWYVPKGA